MKKTNKNKGSSLIEVLIALAVVLLVIVALARGVTTAIKSSEASKRGIQAASYAQEGMENIRAYRDAGWVTFKDFASNHLGLDLDFSGSVPSPSNCSGSTKIVDIFTRCVKFETTDSSRKYKVTVTTTWDDSSGSHSSELVSYFTESTYWTVNIPTVGVTVTPTPTTPPSWYDPSGAGAYLGYGKTCQETGVQSQGGQAAGLGYKSGDPWGNVAGVAVTACVRADFGAVYSNVLEARVLHQAANSTCTGGNRDGCGPTDSGSGTNCNTGGFGEVFRSTDSVTWTRVGSLPRQTSLTWANFTLSGSLRYLLVCRDGAGYSRDNLQIDSVQIKR